MLSYLDVSKEYYIAIDLKMIKNFTETVVTQHF
jgi:hypothetical protein